LIEKKGNQVSTPYLVERESSRANVHTARKLVARVSAFFLEERLDIKYIIHARRARSLPSNVELFPLDDIREGIGRRKHYLSSQ